MDYDYTYTDSYSSSADAGIALAALVPLMLFYVAAIVFSVVVLWKVFTKAGKPGWASIVPFYNVMVLAEITGRPSWVGLLSFVPLLNIYVGIILMLDLAKSFGKDVLFGILMILFGSIPMAFIAFDKNAKFVGPVSTGKTLEP
jgi:hypothetical protein